MSTPLSSGTLSRTTSSSRSSAPRPLTTASSSWRWNHTCERAPDPRPRARLHPHRARNRRHDHRAARRRLVNDACSSEREPGARGDAARPRGRARRTLGFAVANGRCLVRPPRPAMAGKTSRRRGLHDHARLEAPLVIQPGFLPAITLGIGPTNNVGQLVDAWGNPVRYAVARMAPVASVNALTTLGALKAAGYSGLTPDLTVCVNYRRGRRTCARTRVTTQVVSGGVFRPARAALPYRWAGRGGEHQHRGSRRPGIRAS